MDYRARTGAGSQIVPLTVDAPYFNSYWLYQITVWTIYRVWGTAGLVASHYLAAIVAYALVASQAVKRAGGISPWLAPLLLIGLFGNYWEVRPHVVSWLFLALLLGLLDRRDTRWIWISPVLMLVWANAHSLFILGWVAIAAHAVEVFRLGKAGAHRRFWFAAALSLAAPLANPYGWQGICVPFQQWQNLQTGSAFKSAEFGIHEHLSPFSLFRYFAATGEFRLVQPVLAMHLFTALAALTLLISIRRVCLREWLLVGLFGYVYSLAEKNFGYFLIAAFPIVAGHLDGLASRQTAGRSAQLIRALPAATAALAAAGTWWVLSGNYFEYLKSPMRTGHRFNPDFLPVGAAAFINAAGLPSGARILNNLDAGGYLAFATRRDVFIDGSLESIPGMFYREYARSKDLRELPSFLARWRPDAVVIPYSDIPPNGSRTSIGIRNGASPISMLATPSI
ncbi:MAG: hypothetical protein NZ740_01905 [Kiritimatiellae bacterium]|nr:hypothetical protein [Kiritimatiellia bacterium]MDW8457845.1 hypothetical protein [Verrucomicrobiota bacterium]